MKKEKATGAAAVAERRVLDEDEGRRLNGGYWMALLVTILLSIEAQVDPILRGAAVGSQGRNARSNGRRDVAGRHVNFRPAIDKSADEVRASFEVIARQLDRRGTLQWTGGWAE